MEEFGITFDNPLATYFCGDTVTGHVFIKLKKEMRMKAMDVHFVGAAEVRWTERHSRQQGKSRVTRTTVYSSREVYFDSLIRLLGSEEGDTTLPAGTAQHAFSLALPLELPASFEGDLGHVRYTVKATVRRPWKLNRDCKAAFTVLHALDLNAVAGVQDAVVATAEAALCCCCCRSGPIALTTRLPCWALVPGQPCQAMLDVDNRSRADLLVKCSLMQRVSYAASAGGGAGGRLAVQERRRAVAEQRAGAVARRRAANLLCALPTPPLPPSFLLHCSLIDVAYYLLVECEVKGPHSNVRLEVPLVIGTVPLRPPPPPSATAASAPPPPPPIDLPPPSYEECVCAKGNIRGDDDSEHNLGDTEFAPRYPLYRFD